MEFDARGRLWLLDTGLIARKPVPGAPKLIAIDSATNAVVKTVVFPTVAHDPRLLWPDTLELAADGYLYVTVNQLQRQPNFHAGQDRRRPPFCLFRMKIDGAPIQLR